MAQMPIQLLPGRAEPFFAQASAAAANDRRATPHAVYPSDPGAISGGQLRPGSIEQDTFKAHLDAARKESAAAMPAPAATAPAPAAPRGIPTLTPAQLAALGVDVSQLPPEAPQPQAAAAADPIPTVPSVAPAGGAAGGSLAYALDPAAPQPVSGESAAPSARTETAALPPAADPARQRESGPIPGARRGADGAWELPRLPDKDERDMLRGQKWRVVESPESRALFLGPDGEFGWDDFLDLINPLQHIPLVNIAYRAITGDEIYGAARMVDLAFGPIAGASTAIDLAFRDVTGESMAENAVAAVFGTGDQPTGDLSVNTASGGTQLADAAAIRHGSNR